MSDSLLILIASLAIGIKLRVPPRALLAAAVIASAGSAAAQRVLDTGGSQPEALFVAAMVVALAAELLARQMKLPALVLSVPGIIPLVPGSLAYSAMAAMVEGDNSLAAERAVLTALSAGGVSSGLLLATALCRQLPRYGPRRALLEELSPEAQELVELQG
ncbi:MAG: threonine/serine exporter family protein [Vulcanimicrobiota bacterium]